MFDVFYCICLFCWCVKVVVIVRKMQGGESFKKKTNQTTN